MRSFRLCAIISGLLALLLGVAIGQTTLSSGNKTVTTGGTAERLHATDGTNAYWIVIQADCDNTNNALIDWDNAPEVGGIELDACESVRFEPNDRYGYFDLNDIWVDVDTDGEGVHFIYEALPG